MPHATAVFPFEPGDDDVADFMLDIWLPFARDSCNWVDNRAPVVGARPDSELWTHRGTVGVPLAPYVFFRTFAADMMIFTGNGVNTAEEIYDQPANPANAPFSVAMNAPQNGSISAGQRTSMINAMAGPYSAYWLFCDTSGSYIHCVVRVNSRQYRHFHIGLLQQIDGGNDLDSESFYVTGHFWSELDPNPVFYPTIAIANNEHSPYAPAHQPPFRSSGGTSTNGAFGVAMLNTAPPVRFYMPGLNPIIPLTAVVNAGGTGHAVNDVITLDNGTDLTGTPAQLLVTAVTGGVIDTVSIDNVGAYTNRPNTVAGLPQASTTGAGIDATFDLTFEGHSWYQLQDNDGLLCQGSPATKLNLGAGIPAVGNVNTAVPIGQAQSNFYDSGLGTVPWAADRNFSANANILVPIYISAAFDFQSDIRQGIVAQVPDVFRVNMRDYSPEDVITVGGEDYIVFPMINQDAVSTIAGEGYSGYEGLAYRRETGAVV